MSYFEEKQEQRRKIHAQLDALTTLCRENAKRSYEWNGLVVQGPEKDTMKFCFPGLNIRVTPRGFFCYQYDPYMFDEEWILNGLTVSAAEILGVPSLQGTTGKPHAFCITPEELVQHIRQLMDLQNMLQTALELELGKLNNNPATAVLTSAVLNAQALVEGIYGYGLFKGKVGA